MTIARKVPEGEPVIRRSPLKRRAVKPVQAWAVEWRSHNLLDGDQRHLMFRHPPRLYFTRKECLADIDSGWGYLRQRPDLHREPYGWRMPRPVRVTITANDS